MPELKFLFFIYLFIYLFIYFFTINIYLQVKKKKTQVLYRSLNYSSPKQVFLVIMKFYWVLSY